MIYLRYEFNDKEQAEAKILAQEGVNAAFIKLNKFILTEGVYDEDGVEITAPIFSSGYSVDVLWRDLEASPYGWKSYEKHPETPRHNLF